MKKIPARVVMARHGRWRSKKMNNGGEPFAKRIMKIQRRNNSKIFLRM